jgi:hypothetical protein
MEKNVTVGLVGTRCGRVGWIQKAQVRIQWPVGTVTKTSRTLRITRSGRSINLLVNSLEVPLVISSTLLFGYPVHYLLTLLVVWQFI